MPGRAEQNSQPTDYFERFVSLDDDVQSFQSTRGDQLAVPMEEPLRELQQHIKHMKDNGEPEPGLAGFLAFRPTAPPSCAGTPSRRSRRHCATPRAASALPRPRRAGAR